MPPVLELTFPAEARYLMLARLGLAGVAPVARLDAEEVADLKLAVTEACANAVRHAYPEGVDGTVAVRISVEGRSVTVEVEDAGRGVEADRVREWDPTDLQEHGMGFSIIRSVTDGFELDASEAGGTIVRFSKRAAALAD